MLKGFSFPKDVPLFIRSGLLLAKWDRRVRKLGFNAVVSGLDESSGKTIPSQDKLNKLTKYHRILYYYLGRILRHGNPCTIASLCLFELCKGMDIHCRLIVGADKVNGSIVGHSWVEIEGKAINEDADSLGRYVVMIEV